MTARGRMLLCATLLLLGGCVDGTEGSPTAETSATVDTMRAEQTLAGLAADLRKAIDTLAEIPTTGDNFVSMDDRNTCGDISEDWPAQWVHSRSLLIKGVTDSRPAAEEMLAGLERQGWRINRDVPGNTDGESRAVAVKDGLGMAIGAGPGSIAEGGAGLVIQGSTPCVSADGKVDGT